MITTFGERCYDIECSIESVWWPNRNLSTSGSGTPATQMQSELIKRRFFTQNVPLQYLWNYAYIGYGYNKLILFIENWLA